MPTIKGRRWLSPPPLKKDSIQEKAHQCDAALAKARCEPSRSSVSFGKFALAALAVGTALTGCRGSDPEPVEPGAYEMVDPSVVVLDSTLVRVDIDRGIELDCPPEASEPVVCTTAEVEYHPVGILLGHGVVRDLNGNLFAVPQLQVKNNVTVALKNPDYAKLETPGLKMNNAELRQTEPGVFTLDAEGESQDYKIELRGGDAQISKRQLGGFEDGFKVERRSRSQIVVQGADTTNIASKGEHLEVRDADGGYPTRIVHTENTYTVKGPDSIPEWDISFKFEPGVMTRKDEKGSIHYEAYPTSSGFELGTGPDQSVHLVRTEPGQGYWGEQQISVTFKGGELIHSPF